MLRTVSLPAWLVACTFSLSVVVMAQNPTPPSRVAAPEAHSLTPPGLFDLAQAGAGGTSLADRLQAIRGGTQDAGASSRRTASRTSPPPSTTPADLETAPDDGLSREAGKDQYVDQLPSVLVRRGNSPAGPAPITDASQLPAPGTVATENVAPIVEEVKTDEDAWDSSSRTARRWREPTTTYPTQPQPSMPAFTAAPVERGTERRASSAESPSLRVEAIGPQSIAVGKPATYRIRLLNQGSSSAQQVVVSITVPASVQLSASRSEFGSVEQSSDTAGRRQISWALEQVTANSQQELVLQLQPTENQPIDLQVDWMTRPASLAARIEVQQPQLVVSLEGPAEMRFGEARVFKVRLSNPGNGPAEQVSVAISAPGANSEPGAIGTLGAGESRTLELEMTAKQAGAMEILAVARGEGDLQAEAKHAVHVRRAALAVQVSAPAMLYAGTTASYQIRVANRGDAVAEGVIMQVELPTGATNGLGVDKKPISQAQPRWRIGDMAPGAESVYSMQCDLTVSGQNQLVVNLQGTDNSVASDTALTKVEALADLKLMVSDPAGPLPVGQEVVYEIKLVNRGSKEATNIELIAQFSEGIEPTAAAGHRAEIAPGQVVFAPIASIPAGSETILKVTARATQGGNLRFRAELNCGDPETKLVAEESTHFYVAGNPSGAAAATSAQPTPARR